jgi:hypothetical protein
LHKEIEKEYKMADGATYVFYNSSYISDCTKPILTCDDPILESSTKILQQFCLLAFTKI